MLIKSEKPADSTPRPSDVRLDWEFMEDAKEDVRSIQGFMEDVAEEEEIINSYFLSFPSRLP